MTIELWDMDVPYEVQTDCNAEGKDFIRISPNPSANDPDDSNNLCLTKDKVEELIRVLTFIKEEIK